MDWLWWVAGICFVVGGIIWYWIYKKEKEKNPTTTTMLSVLSKPSHEVLEKELKKIMDEITAGAVRVEYLANKHMRGENVDYFELNVEIAVFFGARDEFNAIYSAVKQDGKYKGTYLLKNDLVLMNDCLNKINTKTTEVEKLIDKALR